MLSADLERYLETLKNTSDLVAVMWQNYQLHHCAVHMQYY